MLIDKCFSQVLSQQRADKFEPRKTVQNEPITSSFHRNSVEGRLRHFLYFINYSLTET